MPKKTPKQIWKEMRKQQLEELADDEEYQNLKEASKQAKRYKESLKNDEKFQLASRNLRYKKRLQEYEHAVSYIDRMRQEYASYVLSKTKKLTPGTLVSYISYTGTKIGAVISHWVSPHGVVIYERDFRDIGRERLSLNRPSIKVKVMWQDGSPDSTIECEELKILTQ